MVDEQSIYLPRLTLSSCSKAFCQELIVRNTFGRQHGLTAASFGHHNFQYISNQTKYGKRAWLMNSLSISPVYSHNPTLTSCSKTFCQKPFVQKPVGQQHGQEIVSFSCHNFQYICNQTKHGKQAWLISSLSISPVYSHNPTLSSCSKTFCQKPIVRNTFGPQHGLTAASFSHHNFQYISNQTKYGKQAWLMSSLSISHV